MPIVGLEPTYVVCSKLSYLNFSRISRSSTGSVHLCRCGRVHLCACMKFFPPIESVSSRQSVNDCVSVVNPRQIVSYCKITERLEHWYCINFAKSLAIPKWKLFEKFNRPSGTMP